MLLYIQDRWLPFHFPPQRYAKKKMYCCKAAAVVVINGYLQLAYHLILLQHPVASPADYY